MKEGFGNGTGQLQPVRTRRMISRSEIQGGFSTFKSRYLKPKEDLVETMCQNKVLWWMMSLSSTSLLEDLPLSDTQSQSPSQYRSDTSLAQSRNSTEPSTRQLSQGDSMFASTSHDLRTPLTTAVSVLQILLDSEGGVDEADRKDLIKKAWSSLQYALLLINNVLDFSKLHCTGIKPVLSQVSVRHLACEVLRNLEVQASHEKTELVLESHQSIPSLLRTDRIMLQRVMMNLVSNSLKFTSGGRVTVKIFWEAAQSQLHVCIQDTGSGMTPEEVASLFQRFYQTGHKKGGTGLGLSISRELVAALGGFVEASSAGKGLGSSFQFNMYAPVAGNATSWVDCSAIVIDSDPARGEALCQLLKYIGVCVLDPGVKHDEAPKIAFLCALEPSWANEARAWRSQGCAVCVVVPNTVPVKPSGDHFQAVVRSPLEVDELREVISKVAEAPFVRAVSEEKAGDFTTEVSSEILPVEGLKVLLTEDNKINHALFLRFAYWRC